jgi:hypothetical protein
VARKLNDVAPREVAGAGAGKAFEYQYHRAAAACLELLEVDGPNCVFCEWHDDYVLESTGAAFDLYGFYQVKTKSRGAWTLGEIFGLRRPSKKEPSPPAHEDSPAARLLLHFGNFEEACDRVVLVTDAPIADAVGALLDDIRKAATPVDLPAESKEAFQRIAGAYASVLPGVPEGVLFLFLKRLHVHSHDRFDDLRKHFIEMQWRIQELSEVDLRASEAKRIGRNLVDLVRLKSQSNPGHPIAAEDLKKAKGIIAEEVLPLLSLSREGYRELKKVGRDPIRALSRLHRMCQRCNVPEQLIPEFCRLKALWDVWWHENRHLIDATDQAALDAACMSILREWSDGRFDIARVAVESKDVATKYAGLSPSVPLTKDLVFGRVLGLAAEPRE